MVTVWSLEFAQGKFDGGDLTNVQSVTRNIHRVVPWSFPRKHEPSSQSQINQPSSQPDNQSSINQSIWMNLKWCNLQSLVTIKMRDFESMTHHFPRVLPKVTLEGTLSKSKPSSYCCCWHVYRNQSNSSGIDIKPNLDRQFVILQKEGRERWATLQTARSGRIHWSRLGICCLLV